MGIMSWENIIKRERTELSTLVGEVSDLAIELHILVPLDKESESNPIWRKIEEKLKKIHDLEMARFWAEQNRRE
tara:strand:- start:309 stop:530 length:222 start_codon:yes stop_codon:yes gene_type:complete